jgi:hypothetical protein
MEDFNQKLESANTVQEIFDLVKQAAWKVLKSEQAGLMVGLADMPTNGAWLGAYYSPDANTIVMNKLPLRKIKTSSPSLFKPYVFHILLHEYVHSLGYYDEQQARQVTLHITKQVMGEDHITAQMAQDISAFMERVGYSELTDLYFGSGIEFIEGIDRRNTDYIQ